MASSRASALRAAEKTRHIGGVRPAADHAGIHPVNGYVVLVGLVLATSAGVVGFGFPALVAGLAALLLAARVGRRSLLRSNAAVEQLREGKLEAAAEEFRIVATTWTYTVYVQLGLQNLAHVAYLQGDLEDAVLLHRAALALEADEGLVAAFKLRPAVGRANAAAAFAATGAVDEASRLLDETRGAADAVGRGLRVRARLLTLCKRGRHREVLALLEKRRALLENTLVGAEGVLVACIEAVARSAVGEVTDPVVVPPWARRLVEKVLPEAARHTVIVDSERSRSADDPR